MLERICAAHLITQEELEKAGALLAPETMTGSTKPKVRPGKKRSNRLGTEGDDRGQTPLLPRHSETVAQNVRDSSQWILQTMNAGREGDLFGADSRSDLFDEDAPTPVYRADPDEVRVELLRILAEARAAKKLPWEPKQVSLYRTIFPQMTNWLPDEEAAQLRFEFDTEMARLEAA